MINLIKMPEGDVPEVPVSNPNNESDGSPEAQIAALDANQQEEIDKALADLGISEDLDKHYHDVDSGVNVGADVNPQESIDDNMGMA